jgi:ubiquinone/menaquinone biosynthesis C-methylase UbiE
VKPTESVRRLVAPPRLYVCGHSARELDRLEIQGAYFRDITRRFLRAAGLRAGMKVLDIGCGAGDVSLVAAAMVGRSGRVLGIDRSARAVAVARARARRSGVTQAVFRVGDFRRMRGRPVDALVGRFVLMHQRDPAGALRGATRQVRRGGLVAMLESHLVGSTRGSHSLPHSPTYDRVLKWMISIIRAAGAHPDMGLRLHGVFQDAGLPGPRLWVQARGDGGRDAPVYEYIAESVRSMAPLAARLGISGLSRRDLEQMEQRLREDTERSDGVLVSPLVVGAWSRTGADRGGQEGRRQTARAAGRR